MELFLFTMLTIKPLSFSFPKSIDSDSATFEVGLGHQALYFEILI